MAWPLRGGGGVKGQAIKEKITFFVTFFANVQKFRRPLSSRVGGGLGLNGPAIKTRTFFAASLGKFIFFINRATKAFTTPPPQPAPSLAAG